MLEVGDKVRIIGNKLNEAVKNKFIGTTSYVVGMYAGNPILNCLEGYYWFLVDVEKVED